MLPAEVTAVPQGTIKSYDPETKSGVLLDDAKNEIVYDAESFRETGMREFRIGQRVSFQREGERVRDLRILTV